LHPHRIDTHHHILPPKYFAEERERVLAAAAAGSWPVMRQWTPQMAVDVMDRDGVATAVTSISAPGIWFGDPAQTRRLARECNDYAAGMGRDHNGRFGLFAVLPIPDIDGCLREIEYVFDVLKADGIGLVTSFSNKSPGDPAFAPVFDELNRRKAVVYFHPTVPDCCTGLVPGIGGAMVEFPFDTTRAIISLLFGGTFARCPDIRFIFSHAGGTLPALAPRIAMQAARRKDLAAHAPHGAMHEFRKLYYDIVSAADPLPFNAIRAIAGTAHLLYGSDFPFWDPHVTSDYLAKLDLTAAELRAIERDNALGLLPGLGRKAPVCAAAG
jgi:predicted TIM-barrel fold metal-dependent hydrolase